jgi:putative DNA primase/helicase
MVGTMKKDQQQDQGNGSLSPCQVAKAYSKFNISVFPCIPLQKKPAIPEWQKKATKDSVELEKLFREGQEWNVAAPCGSGNGFFVLDLDGKEGLAWAKQHGLIGEPFRVLLETWVQRTPSGGLHFFFAYPEGVEVRNSAGKLAPGVDVRGEGGYVLLPPSKIDFAKTHKNASGSEVYTWIRSPRAGNLKPAPQWLLDALNAKSAREVAAKSFEGPIPEGKRNSALASLAGTLRRKGFPQGVIEKVLQDVNAEQCQPPLPEGEVSRIAQSISRYEPEENVLEEAGNASDGGQKGKKAARGEKLQHPRVRVHGKIVDATEDLVAEKVMYCFETREWYQWNPGISRWENCGPETAERIIREVLRDVQLPEQTLNRVLHSEIDGIPFVRTIARGFAGMPKIAVRQRDLDSDPWVFAFSDGYVRLGKTPLPPLQPIEPKMRITKGSPLRAGDDNRLGCPMWLEHLQKCLPNENVRREVQRQLGSGLVGKQLLEYVGVWWGTGANGKTTTRDVVMRVLGDYAVVGSARCLVDSQYGLTEQLQALAQLAGTRLAFFSEPPGGLNAFLNDAMLKRLVGSSVIEARKLYGHLYNYRPGFTVILETNNRPKSVTFDPGTWRRLRLVPWTITIPKEERIPDLAREIYEREALGVFLWLVDGLNDVLLDPHWECKEVAEATEEWRGEDDILGQFIKECCEVGPYEESMRDLHKAYCAWALAERLATEKTLPLAHQLSKQLTNKGFRSAKRKHVRVKIGLRLLVPPA